MSFEGSMQTIVSTIADMRCMCVSADVDAKMASDLNDKYKFLTKKIESLDFAIGRSMRGTYAMMKKDWKKLSGKTIRPIDMDKAYIDAMLLTRDKVKPAKSFIQDPYRLVRCFLLSVLYNNKNYAQCFAEVDLKAGQRGCSLPWAFNTRIGYSSPHGDLSKIEKDCADDVMALMEACTDHLNKAPTAEVCAMNAKILHCYIDSLTRKWVKGVQVFLPPSPLTKQITIKGNFFGEEVGKILDSFARNFNKFRAEFKKLQAATTRADKHKRDFIQAQKMIAFNNLLGALEEMLRMFSLRALNKKVEQDEKVSASAGAAAAAVSSAPAPNGVAKSEEEESDTDDDTIDALVRSYQLNANVFKGVVFPGAPFERG